MCRSTPSKWNCGLRKEDRYIVTLIDPSAWCLTAARTSQSQAQRCALDRQRWHLHRDACLRDNNLVGGQIVSCPPASFLQGPMGYAFPLVAPGDYCVCHHSKMAIRGYRVCLSANCRVDEILSQRDPRNGFVWWSVSRVGPETAPGTRGYPGRWR